MSRKVWGEHVNQHAVYATSTASEEFLLREDDGDSGVTLSGWNQSAYNDSINGTQTHTSYKFYKVTNTRTNMIGSIILFLSLFASVETWILYLDTNKQRCIRPVVS